MKFYYALISVLVCLSILLIQPQLTHHNDEIAVANTATVQSHKESSDAIIYLFKETPLVHGIEKFDQGDYKGAIADFDEALRTNPDDARIYIYRSRARAKLGNLWGALSDYQKAEQLDPALVKYYTKLYNSTNWSPLESHSTKQQFEITLFVSIILCLVWILSISFHEFGHAIIAYLGGDKSVKQKGYLTLNPFKYVHPLTSIIIPGLLFLVGEFPLPGAAVYIKRQNLRNRWWQSAVSAAGPLASFLFVGAIAVFLRACSAWNLPDWFLAALASFITLQLFFVLFNLIPIPPLDGYGIIEAWLPNKIQAKIRKFSIVGLIALYILPWLIPSLGIGLAVSGLQIAQWFGVPLRPAVYGFKLFNRWYCALVMAMFGIFLLTRQPQLIWNFLGFVLSSRFKKYEKALAAFDKAVKLNPNDPWSWHQRGWVLEELERYELALANYDKAIDLEPDNAWTWGRRGWVLEELERYELALTNYDKVIDLQPDNAWAWGRRGWTLKGLQRYELALEALDKSIKLDPKSAWVWRYRGWVLEKLERYELALTNYDKAIDLEPKNAWTWGRRGWVLEKLERYELALTNYDKAIDLEPNNAWTWGRRGCTLKALQRYELALAALDKSIELDPKSAWVWYRRGCVLEKLERYELALTNYDKALDLEPDDAETLSRRSSVLEKLQGH